MNRQNDENIDNMLDDSRDLYSDSSAVSRAESGKQGGENGDNKSKIAAAADVDDYVFLNSVRKKKKVKRTSNSASVHRDDIVVRNNTSNRMSKHKKRHRHRKHRKMKRWKKALIAIASTLLALVLLFVGTVAYLIYRGGTELFNSEISVTAPDGVSVQENGKYVVYNGDTYKFNDSVTNILFIGVDKRDIDDMSEISGTGGQADVLVLASVDTSTGKISLVNISRETMTDVTVYSAGGSYLNTETQQICLAYAYGDGKDLSCENTVSSVKKLFYNIPINTYYALDLDGISAINDIVGGVDVVSPETIGEFTAGQSYHLMGEHAENFVRLRDTENIESNNLRMERQKVYIQSFLNKTIEQTKQDFGTPINLYNDSAPYSCTNLNPSKVCYLAQTAIKNGSMAIDMVSVPGEVTMGKKYAEFNVDEKAFYEQFLSIYYTKM